MDKIENPRLLLAKLRDGDFAHAGDKEAIDIVLSKLAEFFKGKNNIHALDVGAGLGGTADYIKNKTNIKIIGVDIDQNAVHYAKKKYPNIEFYECDALNVNKIFKKQQFDLIYLFNVFYAVPDQKNTLIKLNEITKPGGILVIFDYTINDFNLQLKDLAGKNMMPVNINEIQKWFQNSNWQILEIQDLTEEYIRWYKDFLALLKARKNELLQEFTEMAYFNVESTFSTLLENLKNKKLHGSVIYAIKHSG